MSESTYFEVNFLLLLDSKINMYLRQFWAETIRTIVNMWQYK